MNQLTLEQANNLLHTAINKPETIKGGEAVDLLRTAVGTFVQAINDGRIEADELKAKLKATEAEVINLEHRLQEKAALTVVHE